MSHTCHAHGCEREVPPRMFMCIAHWRTVKPRLQQLIWRFYRPGQENDKKASAPYLCVQQRAVGEVAFKPNDEVAANVSADYIIKSEMIRRQCIDGGLGDPLSGYAQKPMFTPGMSTSDMLECVADMEPLTVEDIETAPKEEP